MQLRPPPITNPPARQGRFGLFLLLQGITLAAVVALFFLGRDDPNAAAREAAAQRTREVASKLKAAGVASEAAALYERYLTDATLPPEKRAVVAYALGQQQLDAGQYESALRWFYEAESLGGGGRSSELGEKIVHTLERLGRIHAAQAALASRAALGSDDIKRADTDPVVARIGNDEVHRSEVLRSLDDMPAELRKRFEGQQGQTELVKKYVVDELLWRKAQKLEYQKDPEVRRQLEAMLKQLVIGKFIEQEVLGKITIAAEDLQAYHAANRARYDQSEAVMVRVIQVADRATADSLLAKAKKGADFAALAKEHSKHPSSSRGGALGQWFPRDTPFLSGGDPKAISDALFAAGKGKLAGPIAAGGQHYIFRIEDTRPAKSRSFEEARDQVERDYRLMKTQVAYQTLVEQELTTEDVQILAEGMNEGDAPAAP